MRRGSREELIKQRLSVNPELIRGSIQVLLTVVEEGSVSLEKRLEGLELLDRRQLKSINGKKATD
jgi:hypothetical protein